MRFMPDKLFYRVANTIATTIAHNNGAPSGWTAFPGDYVGVKGLGDEPDGTSDQTDGTKKIGSIKVAPEITLENVSASDQASLRAALLNVKVDLLAYNSKNTAGGGWCVWGVRLGVAAPCEFGEEPKVICSSELRNGETVNIASRVAITT